MSIFLFIYLLKDGSSYEIFWVGNKAHKFGVLKMDSRSYSLMPPSLIIFSKFVFAHSSCFSAERRRCGTRAVPAHYHCHWSAEQSWSYPENNILRYAVLNHLAFAVLVLKHAIFPYPCKGRDNVEVKMSSPRRREARPSCQWYIGWHWFKESMKPCLWARLLYTLPSARVIFCIPLWPRG